MTWLMAVAILTREKLSPIATNRRRPSMAGATPTPPPPHSDHGPVGMAGSVPTRFLDRPDGRIAYDVVGDGPLVVCVPGMGDPRSVYRFLSPVLVDAGFRVAPLDLRGHGDSDATFRAYDDVAAGRDILALVAELGGPPIGIGNSMGG